MLAAALLSAARFADITTPEFNPDDVTPGVIGFAFTALFAVAVILVGIDMYRRVRRMRYREEVREEIQSELARGDGETPESGTRTEPGSGND